MRWAGGNARAPRRSRESASESLDYANRGSWKDGAPHTRGEPRLSRGAGRVDSIGLESHWMLSAELAAQVLHSRPLEPGHVHLGDAQPLGHLGLGQLLDEAQSHDAALAGTEMGHRPLDDVAHLDP